MSINKTSNDGNLHGFFIYFPNVAIGLFIKTDKRVKTAGNGASHY